MFHNDNSLFVLMQLFILTFLCISEKCTAAAASVCRAFFFCPLEMMKMKVEIDLDSFRSLSS
jgi:hypothetical protein